MKTPKATMAGLLAAIASAAISLPAVACISCFGDLAIGAQGPGQVNNVFAYCFNPDLALVNGHGAWIDEVLYRGLGNSTGTEVGYTVGTEYGNVAYSGLYANAITFANNVFTRDYYPLYSNPGSSYNLNIPQEYNSANTDVYVNGIELLANLPQDGNSGADAEMVVWMTNGGNTHSYINSWNRIGGAECNAMQTLSPGHSGYVYWPSNINDLFLYNSFSPHATQAYSYPSGIPTLTWNLAP